VTEKSLIIIGTGLVGLSTGCYAQVNGYQSHIFEHHTMPGGVAAAWKRKGYLIDGGIHFKDLRCEFAPKSLWRVDLTSVRLYNLEGYGDQQFLRHPHLTWCGGLWADTRPLFYHRRKAASALCSLHGDLSGRSPGFLGPGCTEEVACQRPTTRRGSSPAGQLHRSMGH
jgi:hypothetical protein